MVICARTVHFFSCFVCVDAYVCMNIHMGVHLFCCFLFYFSQALSAVHQCHVQVLNNYCLLRALLLLY